jgi:hypothetical protein
LLLQLQDQSQAPLPMRVLAQVAELALDSVQGLEQDLEQDLEQCLEQDLELGLGKEQ